LATATIGPKLFAGGRATASPQNLAVGFSTFAEGARLVSASSIPAADGGFISRGARIAVSGASGASVDPRGRRAVELLTHFSYFDGAERRTTPFRAWACSRTTGCQSSRVSFNVPVDDVQKISFSVVAERGAPPGPKSRRQTLTAEVTESVELPVALSLTSEPDSLKLSRGFYIIVPMFEGDSEPQWSRYTGRQSEGRWALHDSDGAVAPFEHFVLRIDYATL
jgi:hypothetical protein